MGLDLVSRPKGGNIFQQVATSARGPFKEFQARRAAQEDRDWKREWEQEGRDIEAGRFETEVGLKEKEIGYFNFKFYQKLFVILISLSAMLIFPESPRNFENICETYNSRRMCNVW